MCVSFATAESRRIRLATTTSTENSGLLAVLLPSFEEKTGISVDVIAVGTGKALRLGEAGDVDCVLVHARAAEDAFVNAGYGVNRRDVMHNDFVILGPPSDPVGVKSAGSAAEALRLIDQSGSSQGRRGTTAFVSRGDDSGTHKKELQLWSGAGVTPRGTWYKEAGQGMGAVLTLASELGAYSMADRGTFISMRDQLLLVIVNEGDPGLFNPYGIIVVNPALHPHVNYMDAMLLVAWVTSVGGQEIIGAFVKNGEILFYPDAVK